MTGGQKTAFFHKLRRTHLYWLGATTAAFACLAGVIFWHVAQEAGTGAFAVMWDIFSKIGGTIFLWLMGVVGTVGMVLGGSHDAHERGGSCAVSGGLGCLGALLPFTLFPAGSNEMFLVQAFYVMLGCCTGLELAALREEPPVAATPVVPLAIVGLLAVLLGGEPASFLIGVVLLLCQQWLFAVLRLRKNEKSDNEVTSAEF